VRLNASARKLVKAALSHEWDSLPTKLRGMPVRGSRDSRWGHKESELIQMQELSRECASFLVEDAAEQSLVLDLRLIRSIFADPAHLEENVLHLTRLAGSRRLAIPGEMLEDDVLPDMAGLQRSAGCDAWNALDPLFRATLDAPSLRTPAEPQSLELLAASGSVGLAGDAHIRRLVTAHMASGSRLIRLATDRRFWTVADERTLQPVQCVHPTLGLAQVIPEHIGVN
jgi:hypothetical protein